MIKPHVVKLADDRLEGRGGGYPGELKAANYIANEFKRIGLVPMGDARRGRRSYFQEFKFHPYHPVRPWEIMTSRNVLGFVEGSDPQLKNEIVVIGAHYDGQGRAGQADPTRVPATDSDQIWNSANDNATSIAAILEIARAMKTGKILGDGFCALKGRIARRPESRLVGTSTARLSLVTCHLSLVTEALLFTIYHLRFLACKYL